MENGDKVKHKLSGWTGIILSSFDNAYGRSYNVRVYHKANDTFTVNDFMEPELDVVEKYTAKE
jgi:hypothetical protein